MNGNYLIPANTKRGRLILGWFRPFDIILFGSGILVTLLLLAFLPCINQLFILKMITYKERERWGKP